MALEVWDNLLRMQHWEFAISWTRLWSYLQTLQTIFDIVRSFRLLLWINYWWFSMFHNVAVKSFKQFYIQILDFVRFRRLLWIHHGWIWYFDDVAVKLFAHFIKKTVTFFTTSGSHCECTINSLESPKRCFDTIHKLLRNNNMSRHRSLQNACGPSCTPTVVRT